MYGSYRISSARSKVVELGVDPISWTVELTRFEHVAFVLYGRAIT